MNAEIYFARVMLRECRARRHQGTFAHWLLNSAINATRKALAANRGAQLELFGGAA
jgi:hypothetical protein